MKLKKIWTMAVCAACAVALLAAPAAADGPADFNHGIDYTANLNAGRYIVNANTPDAKIDLDDERLYLADGVTVAGISYDGGSRWKSVSIPPEGLDLSKAFNKPTTIVLATDMDGKKPRAASEDGATPAAKLIKFPVIAGRPKLDRIVINYAVDADLTGATSGRWVLTLKDSRVPLTNVQIAPSTNKKTPDIVTLDAQGAVSATGSLSATWGQFGRSGGKTIGVNVIGLNAGGKQQKLNYLVRVAPNAQTRTPASKPKKITAAGLAKATAFKADYKKEILKLKENAAFFKGSAEDLADNTGALSLFGKDAAKAGASLSDLMGQPACIWIAATDKKPATAPQEITFASRGMMKEPNEPLKVSSGKTSVSTKDYEIYDAAKNKWGSLPKLTGAAELRIRMKATAKGGKESDTTKFAASDEGKLVVEWGEYAKGKNGVIGAAILAPEVEGVFRYNPDKTVYAYNESNETFDIKFSFKGLTGDFADVALKLKGKDDSMDSPGEKEIFVKPVVTYANTAAPEDSISWTTALGGGALILTVSPDLACEASIKLETAFGAHTPGFDESNSGGRAAVVKITAVGESLKLNSLKGAYLSGGVRMGMTAIASSGSTPRRAKVTKGAVVISSEGELKLAATQELTGYTSFSCAAVGKDDAPPEDSAFTNDPVDVSHEGWLYVKAEGSGKDTLYFAYETRDGAGARMADAAFSGSQIVVTLDEPLADNAETSGASIVLEGYGAGAPTRNYVGGISVDATKTILTMSISGFTPDPSRDYVLTYNGAMQAGVFHDAYGNAMQPGSVYVGSSYGDGIERIRFENGLRNAPVDVILPESVSSLGALTADNVCSISLAGSNTGLIVIDGGSGVQFARSSALMTTEVTMNSFSDGTIISGLSVGDYLYFKSDGKYYVFQVVKNSSANAADTVRPNQSAGALAKSGGDYTVTLTFSESLIKFGTGPKPNQFRITTDALNNISVSKVSVSGAKLTLTLTGSDLSSITTSSSVKLDYNSGAGGVSDASGNRVLAVTQAPLTLTGFNTVSPSP